MVARLANYRQGYSEAEIEAHFAKKELDDSQPSEEANMQRSPSSAKVRLKKKAYVHNLDALHFKFNSRII